METAIVSLICIALIVFGGMTMSQGFLTSTDTSALRMGEMSVRDGQITRTHVATVDASNVSWANALRVRLANSGQVKLASFDRWDVIVEYQDGSGNDYSVWLPYTGAVLSNNEWHKIGLYQDGKTEVFEPVIFNPGEEMVMGARLSPPPGAGTNVQAIISTPNGIQEAVSFPVGPGYPLLTPHSESRIIATTDYYYLKEGLPSDGSAITETTQNIAQYETGRWLLYNEAEESRLSRHVYSLAGISQIPAAAWTFYYRAQSTAQWVGNAYPALSVDIIIRKADGTVRQTIAADVAGATLNSPYGWQTVSAGYDFPGYTVVADTDYLEIDYYGKSTGVGPEESGAIQLQVDDSGLAAAEQTRIAAQ